MAKRESNFTNMLLTLLVVCFIAASALGLVNEMTKQAIVESNAKAQKQAIEAVLPKFDKLDKPVAVTIEGESESVKCFKAFDASGKLVGVAVESYTKKGFSGLFTVMVGFSVDNKISGYQVLQHQETPGLGSKMQAWFSDNSKPGQNVIGRDMTTAKMTVSKDGGEVDAITAATISSRAFLDAVDRGYKAFKQQVETK